jgi:hypothetical protein
VVTAKENAHANRHNTDAGSENIRCLRSFSLCTKSDLRTRKMHRLSLSERAMKQIDDFVFGRHWFVGVSEASRITTAVRDL